MAVASKPLSMFVQLLLLLLASNCRVSDATLTPPNVIIVGGSSGMGKAAALEAISHGGSVLLVSRSNEKLQRAKQELLQQKPDVIIDTAVCDVTDENQVQMLRERLQQSACHYDGLVITAAGKAAHGPVLTLATTNVRDMLDSKLWGAYFCAKYLSPCLQDGGSVVFCAGILNRRPGLNCASLAMANGALEGLAKSLALEWGPRLRVNCLSPGFCDTERFDHMDTDRKQAMMDNTAASLPLRKVGQPADMGQAIYYLLTAPFCTGVILDVDGGHGIRQYANAQNDPMRKQ